LAPGPVDFRPRPGAIPQQVFQRLILDTQMGTKECDPDTGVDCGRADAGASASSRADAAAHSSHSIGFGSTSPGQIEHVQLPLDSFARLLGRDLVPRDASPVEQARHLFESAFVVVSHGTEADPVLNYANATALRLWEMD